MCAAYTALEVTPLGRGKIPSPQRPHTVARTIRSWCFAANGFPTTASRKIFDVRFRIGRTTRGSLFFFLSVWPSAVDRRCSSGKHCTDLGMQERIGEGIAVRLMAAADDGLFLLLTVVYTSPPPRTLHGGTIESSTDRVTLLRVRPVPPFLCRPLNFDRLVQYTRCS